MARARSLRAYGGSRPPSFDDTLDPPDEDEPGEVMCHECGASTFEGARCENLICPSCGASSESHELTTVRSDDGNELMARCGACGEEGVAEDWECGAYQKTAREKADDLRAEHAAGE